MWLKHMWCWNTNYNLIYVEAYVADKSLNDGNLSNVEATHSQNSSVLKDGTATLF